MAGSVVRPRGKPFKQAHVARPGLIEVDVVAADNRTALAFQQAIAAQWATATAEKGVFGTVSFRVLLLTSPCASPWTLFVYSQGDSIARVIGPARGEGVAHGEARSTDY
ncbi:DUF6207 family protein [Streptomyces sp. NPDC059916]|uniref:DUF6207 family protein n=1 Tax=Streptomyces sp. NPDC059916 TaxID=3347001 RepID=UPI0036B696A8